MSQQSATPGLTVPSHWLTSPECSPYIDVIQTAEALARNRDAATAMLERLRQGSPLHVAQGLAAVGTIFLWLGDATVLNALTDALAQPPGVTSDAERMAAQFLGHVVFREPHSGGVPSALATLTNESQL